MASMDMDLLNGRHQDVQAHSGSKLYTPSFRKGQKIIAAGYYDFKVLIGAVSAYGGCIRKDEKKWYRIYATSTHPLPVIECLSAAAMLSFRSAPPMAGKRENTPALFRTLWDREFLHKFHLNFPYPDSQPFKDETFSSVSPRGSSYQLDFWTNNPKGFKRRYAA